MKINKLIELLTAAQAQHGNLEVQLRDVHGNKIQNPMVNEVFCIRGSKEFTELDFTEVL